MTNINADPSTEYVCLATVNDEFVFQTKEDRDSKLPVVVKVDEHGNPLASVAFSRTVEQYGKKKAVIFEVMMPKNQVDPDIEMGLYTLIKPVVSLYADRKNPGVIRESWTAAGMTASFDSVASK